VHILTVNQLFAAAASQTWSHFNKFFSKQPILNSS